jgi:hypothetical protein
MLRMVLLCVFVAVDGANELSHVTLLYQNVIMQFRRAVVSASICQ